MYEILAYYEFVPLKNPHEEIERHFAFCRDREIRGRLYLSEQGINGQMSAAKQDAEAYRSWMSEHPLFHKTKFKVHRYHEHAFEKLTIKYRRQLCALDREVDLAKAGERLAPKEWREMLEAGGEKLLLDVRNDYETAIGRFEGAIAPPCSSFREFAGYAETLKRSIDPKNTPVMMYCTGGIRCELYSSYLKERGFEKVYQLEGGVIGYGQQEGSAFWLGKLFVFDDRMAVSISEEEAPVIGSCHACGSPEESYYNCANMDCNELFICCSSCLKEGRGCCSSSCREAPRVRPLLEQHPHKPFRKRHRYFKARPDQ